MEIRDALTSTTYFWYPRIRVLPYEAHDHERADRPWYPLISAAMDTVTESNMA